MVRDIRTALDVVPPARSVGGRSQSSCIFVGSGMESTVFAIGQIGFMEIESKWLDLLR